MSLRDDIIQATSSAQNVPFVGPKQRKIADAIVALPTMQARDRIVEAARAFIDLAAEMGLMVSEELEAAVAELDALEGADHR